MLRSYLAGARGRKKEKNVCCVHLLFFGGVSHLILYRRSWENGRVFFLFPPPPRSLVLRYMVVTQQSSQKGRCVSKTPVDVACGVGWMDK